MANHFINVYTRPTMEKKNRKVLLAVNGTDESMTSVRYICKSLPTNGSHIVIYQVLSAVPEVFWDLGNDPAWKEKIETIRAWETAQNQRAEIFMKRAASVFTDAGFPADAVKTRISRQNQGIARDLVAESRKGYDILAISRGESASNPDMPLGGVASKLLATVSAPSIWLIGGQPQATPVLVALDASDNAFKMIEHVGNHFDRSLLSVTLFHAVRGISVSTEGMETFFPDDYGKHLLEDAAQTIRPVMEKAKDRLIAMGIAADRITLKLASGVSSRASAIVDEANRESYGTIVVGRRGLSNIADFSMGRVTNKLTQLARTQALCIVA